MKKIGNFLGIILSLVVLFAGGYLIYLSLGNLPEFGESTIESKPDSILYTEKEPFYPDTAQNNLKPIQEEKIQLGDSGKEKPLVPSNTLSPDSGDGTLSPHVQIQKKRREIPNSDHVFLPEFNPNTFFTRVAHYAIPRVVRILVSQEENKSFFWNPFNDEEGNNDFFQGIGSGAIISEDGYIITNNHVVDNASKILVTLYDGEEYPASIVGKDPLTDLALIKIEAENKLPYLTFYQGDSLHIGEWVLAVGSPLNLTSSVTAGIISALSRNIRIIESSYGIESFIQTDAVINPGNSGGPLLNIRGEIIGLNTAIASKTGYYQSFGFAIPVDIIRRVVKDLKKFGEVKRGYLGVSITPVPFEIAKKSGLKRPMGVLVTGVQKDMPAYKVGIKKGDIIIKINDEPVFAPNQLQAKVSKFYPGDPVQVTLLRNGKEKNFIVKLKEVKSPIIAEKKKEKELNKIEIPDLNLVVRNLTKDEYDKYNTSYGVIVEKSDKNKEIPERSILLEINDHKIFNVNNFKKLYEFFKSQNKKIHFLVKIPTKDGFWEKEILVKE